MFNSCSYERIDAGYEGILVNLYGDDKGVGDVSMCTGAVWYNPFTQSVYEYPTFVQTVDYEPFTINAKDGSEFTVDKVKVAQRELESRIRGERPAGNHLIR